MLTIVNNLGLTTEQRTNVTSIVEVMQWYVDGHINGSFEQRNFRRRVQQVGESFDDFLVPLRELAKTCNFCSDRCTQKNLRDQAYFIMINGDAVEDLLQETGLTLRNSQHQTANHIQTETNSTIPGTSR